MSYYRFNLTFIHNLTIIASGRMYRLILSFVLESSTVVDEHANYENALERCFIHTGAKGKEEVSTKAACVACT